MGFVAEQLIALVDAGLGNSAYLVDLGDGRALAVDAARDLRALHAAADARGVTVAFAADTHLHADFLTGALQLAQDDGATVLASAAGRRAFAHVPLDDGDEIDLGGLTLQALATPGHTDEHVSYLLLDGNRQLGVFTGGSLIVDAAARTDLLGAGRTDQLARAQYRSLQRLATLPEDTAVWPTHGAGSFCSAPPGAVRTTTVGAQKRTNPLLAAPGEDAFVRQLIDSLGSYPAYFDRLAEVNRRGPAPILTEPGLAALNPADVRGLLDEGGVLVDVRPRELYAAGHIPGSVSIPLRDAFASWLGWLFAYDAPLVFVLGSGQDPEEVVWPALKIGHERLAGELHGGVTAWAAEGGPVTATRLVGAEDFEDRAVLDVRQRAEYAAGHVPGAVHIELGDLPEHAAQLPQRPMVVMCEHGERAMTAASLLERSGHRDVAVLAGGPQNWAQVTGRSLREGT